MTPIAALSQYAQQRDPDAFGYLVERYSGLVYEACRRRLRSRADVDDAVQEVFVKLATKARSIQSDPAGWLHNCAVQTSIDVIRRNQARERRETVYAANQHSRQPDISAPEHAQLMSQIDQALMELKDRDRSAILEYYIQGRTQQEIADELKLSQSAVKRRIDHAVQCLRSLLAKRGVVATSALITTALMPQAQAAEFPPLLKANLLKIGVAGIGPAVPSVSIAAKIAVTVLVAFVCAGVVALMVLKSNNRGLPAPAAVVQIPGGAYFGQSLTGTIAQVFAPGIVSLPDIREIGIAFAPDGRQAFLGVTEAGRSTILHLTAGEQPTTPDFIGVADASEPALSPDGRRLLFIRNSDLWYSDLQNGNWTPARRLPSPINTPAQEWAPSIAMDGTLYFISSRDNDRQIYFIWRSRLRNGAYEAPEKLPEIINSPSGAFGPAIDPQHRYLIFALRNDNTSSDLFISYRDDDDSWTTPVKLESGINTPQLEFCPQISPDGQYLFYSRSSSFAAEAEADIHWIDLKKIGLPK